MPPSSAVTASVMPSFNCSGGVARWISVMPVTMVGAVAAPAMSRQSARTGRAAEPVAASSGSDISAVIPARHSSSRRWTSRA